MNAVRDWLEAIGLSQYADAFEANDIDADLLPRLDDQLLKDIWRVERGTSAATARRHRQTRPHSDCRSKSGQHGQDIAVTLAAPDGNRWQATIRRGSPKPSQ
jgi:SAM domain (Sterile alpha motif)